MGLISFAFPHSNGADPCFMSDSQFDLQEGPSPWPVDDQQLPAAKTTSEHCPPFKRHQTRQRGFGRSKPLDLNLGALGFA